MKNSQSESFDFRRSAELGKLETLIKQAGERAEELAGPQKRCHMLAAELQSVLTYRSTQNEVPYATGLDCLMRAIVVVLREGELSKYTHDNIREALEKMENQYYHRHPAGGAVDVEEKDGKPLNQRLRKGKGRII